MAPAQLGALGAAFRLAAAFSLRHALAPPPEDETMAPRAWEGGAGPLFSLRLGPACALVACLAASGLLALQARMAAAGESARARAALAGAVLHAGMRTPARGRALARGPVAARAAEEKLGAVASWLNDGRDEWAWDARCEPPPPPPNTRAPTSLPGSLPLLSAARGGVSVQ